MPVDFVWKAHHSMIIDNVSDFTHEYLHRKYKPFSDARLTRLETDGDKVHVEYDTHVGGGKISGLFVNREKANTGHMKLCYEYPYQWSNTGDKIKHHCFVLPIDERHTRCFFVFSFRTLRVPVLPLIAVAVTQAPCAPEKVMPTMVAASIGYSANPAINPAPRSRQKVAPMSVFVSA